MLIKTNKELTDYETKDLLHGLEKSAGENNIITLNLQLMIRDLDTSLIYFDLFFSLVSFIAMNLSFFLLLINQTKIINES